MRKSKHRLKHAVSRYGRNASCAIAIVVGGNAAALSIGEPQTLSYLSEPLQVHLAVSEWLGTPHPERFRLRLLPNEAYAAYGLSAPQDRPDDLSVKWQRDATSAPYVVIQTQRPITEPILTLLLELRSGQQVMVRQVDLLLDLPPSYPQRPTIAQASISSRTNVAPVVRTNPQQYGPVRPGESLSKIAQRVRPDSRISLEQMAGALMAANPDAFFGDAHELKAGVLLHVPSANDIRHATPAENLFGSHQPPPRAASKSAADKPATQAFLPRAMYTRGRLWALTMEFPSYETVRPVDLAPTLAALEAAEPILFKADWTLSQAAKVPRNVAAKQPQPSAEPAAASPDPDVTRAVKPVPPSQEQTSQPELEPENVETAPVVTSNENAQSAPQSKVNGNGGEIIAPSPSDSESEPRGFPFWPLLLGAAAVIGFAWWRRQRDSDPYPPRSRRVSPSASSSAQGAVPSDQQLRGTARLKKRIASALQSGDSALQRQAQVVQVLLERGRLEQAEQVSSGLNKAVPSQNDVANAQDGERQSAKTSYTSDSEPTDSQPSEFEQRRFRDQMNKLRRKGLPSDSQRQLKVAEAFFERGNLAQAQTILSELKSSSDD